MRDEGSLFDSKAILLLSDEEMADSWYQQGGAKAPKGASVASLSIPRGPGRRNRGYSRPCLKVPGAGFRSNRRKCKRFVTNGPEHACVILRDAEDF
jgi:hypothetical protein